MIATLALALALQAPPDPWFGADKVKHFLMSAFVHSVTFSVARGAGVDRRGAQVAGVAAVATIGAWKEVHDRRNGRVFSLRDLAWDGAGGVAAAALLNGAR